MIGKWGGLAGLPQNVRIIINNMIPTFDDGHPVDVYLSDVSERDRPWDVHSYQRELVSGLYRLTSEQGSDFWRYADRMDDCSKLLDFVLKSNDLGECKLKLQMARFCRVRYCPVCQWRKSMMWRARFLLALPKILAAYSDCQFIFQTLTIRNCELEELRLTVQKMAAGWKRLSESKDFPAIGYLRALEVTRAKDDRAHPHYHCLLMVPRSYFKSVKYLNYSKWVALWQRSLRVDYSPQLSVSVARSKAGATEGVEAVRLAAMEVIKYSVKPGDLIGQVGLDGSGDLLNTSQNWFSSTWLLELTEQMHNVHAISVGGVFRKFLSEKDPEDLIHPEGQELDEVLETDLHVFFGWRSSVKRYAKNDA